MKLITKKLKEVDVTCRQYGKPYIEEVIFVTYYFWKIPFWSECYYLDDGSKEAKDAYLLLHYGITYDELIELRKKECLEKWGESPNHVEVKDYE